jgi:hypothetical protein
MTRTENNIRTVICGMALAAIVLLLPFGMAHANPSSFANGVTTGNAASTSPAYMTPGAGTSTTPVFDAYAQTMSGGATSKVDQAALLVQFTASSTTSVLNIAVEYSQDAIDWYRNYIIDPTQVGTTTALGIGTPFSTTWKFASSSVGGAVVPANSNRSTATILVPTPLRYTRIVASMTGANGAVWMQLVPIKEQR